VSMVTKHGLSPTQPLEFRLLSSPLANILRVKWEGRSGKTSGRLFPPVPLVAWAWVIHFVGFLGPVPLEVDCGLMPWAHKLLIPTAFGQGWLPLTGCPGLYSSQPDASYSRCLGSFQFQGLNKGLDECLIASDE
jgi:hypothetical protein